jgi:hypothetical protein
VKPGGYPRVPNRTSCEGYWRGSGLGLKQVFLVDWVFPPKTCGLRHPKTKKNSPAEQGLKLAIKHYAIEYKFCVIGTQILKNKMFFLREVIVERMSL